MNLWKGLGVAETLGLSRLLFKIKLYVSKRCWNNFSHAFTGMLKAMKISEKDGKNLKHISFVRGQIL